MALSSSFATAALLPKAAAFCLRLQKNLCSVNNVLRTSRGHYLRPNIERTWPDTSAVSLYLGSRKASRRSSPFMFCGSSCTRPQATSRCYSAKPVYVRKRLQPWYVGATDNVDAQRLLAPVWDTAMHCSNTFDDYSSHWHWTGLATPVALSAGTLWDQLWTRKTPAGVEPFKRHLKPWLQCALDIMLVPLALVRIDCSGSEDSCVGDCLQAVQSVPDPMIEERSRAQVSALPYNAACPWRVVLKSFLDENWIHVYTVCIVRWEGKQWCTSSPMSIAARDNI